MNLDDHTEGTFDPNNPVNQNDLDDDLTFTVQEWINQGETNEAVYQLSEVRLQIDRLRQVAKASDNQYFFKKLSEIYNKL